MFIPQAALLWLKPLETGPAFKPLLLTYAQATDFIWNENRAIANATVFEKIPNLFFSACNLFRSCLHCLEKEFMLFTAIVLFALAAVLGILILKNWLTSSNTPRTVIYVHGLFAAIAVLLLLIQVIRHPNTALRTSFVFFAAAAAGGLYMFFRDRKGKFSPTWLAVAHGLIAVTGFVFLLLNVL